MIALALALLAAVGGGDLAGLDKKLRSSDDRERAAGVQEAAQLGGKDGWTRVIDALKDASPRVADEAEIQLANLEDKALLAELAGKRGLGAPDPWVQVHAAGALGSVRGVVVPFSHLEAALTDGHAEVRRAACAAVESLGRSNHLSDRIRASMALVRLRKDPDAEVRAAALCAAAAVSGAPGAGLVEASLAENPMFACAVVRLAAEPGADPGRRLLELGTKHAERSVRAQAAEVLIAKPDAERLKMLVDMLAVEKNRRLYWTIDSALERLSGLKGGGKAKFWQGWIAKLGPEWKPVTGDARSRGTSGDTEAPKLAGMPILSERVAILIDFSGSTWQKRADGRTRKDRLDEELKKTLKSLAPDTLFNVIPYTDVPIPWEKGLQPATPANVQRALKFFTGCKASGKGNFWDAAMLAFDDPQVDTILALTDGAPTGGHRWNIDLMRRRYGERNRFRHVALDAVIVDAKKGLQTRWEKFCESTGGRMIAVDL